MRTPLVFVPFALAAAAHYSLPWDDLSTLAKALLAISFALFCATWTMKYDTRNHK